MMIVINTRITQFECILFYHVKENRTMLELPINFIAFLSFQMTKKMQSVNSYKNQLSNSLI